MEKGGTTMTRAEKAGLKAYPENISYSTIGDTMYDYNAEKRRVFIEGYEEGYKDAVRKACEWLKDNHADIFIRYIRGYEADNEIENFKKYMQDETI